MKIRDNWTNLCLVISMPRERNRRWSLVVNKTLVKFNKVFLFVFSTNLPFSHEIYSFFTKSCKSKFRFKKHHWKYCNLQAAQNDDWKKCDMRFFRWNLTVRDCYYKISSFTIWTFSRTVRRLRTVIRNETIKHYKGIFTASGLQGRLDY